MIWLECEDGTLLSFDLEPDPDKETLIELFRRWRERAAMLRDTQWSWDIETEEFARSRRHAISGDDHATFERDRPASTAEEGLDADSDLSYDSTTHTIRPGQRRHRRPTWDGGGWWWRSTGRALLEICRQAQS